MFSHSAFLCLRQEEGESVGGAVGLHLSVFIFLPVIVYVAARLTPLCLLSLPPQHKPIHPHHSAIKQLFMGRAMTEICGNIHLSVCVWLRVREKAGD